MSETFAAASTVAETSVRQLIANGKSKAALDRAKDLHKQFARADTETLLVDAYCARIASLLEHKMAVEAKALIDLVRQRFPAHAAKLDSLGASASARAGSLDALLAPLNQAELDPARRTAIEHALQTDVSDLAAISACAALPPDHPLRVAAAALERAFAAVTSGPLDSAKLELPEVSRRSPLAPWKPLIVAIGCFYRAEDDRCREFLRAIAPGSAAARLVPAIETALGDKPSPPLTAAASNLVRQIRANVAALRDSLQELEEALREDGDVTALRLVQTVFQHCRQHAPEAAAKLRQYVMVRCSLRQIDRPKIVSAMGGEPRADFAFFRLFAKGMEQQDGVECLGVANTMWEEALRQGVKEGRFKPNGPEAAQMYLHMASVIERTPPRTLAQIHLRAGGKGGASSDDIYFLFPEKLYQRAAAIHADSEVFSKWLEWAKVGPRFEAERVAEAWHKACPNDVQPLLYLVEALSGRKSYKTALKYLAAAERIDGTHPVVRMERVRLVTGSLLNQLKKKNVRLAEATLAELAAFPSLREGDRPAFLAALRCLVARVREDPGRAEDARREVEALMGDRTAAQILLCAVTEAAKFTCQGEIYPLEQLTAAERHSIPAGIARAFVLGRDFDLDHIRVAVSYINETVRQLPAAADSLSIGQLQCLAEEAIGFNQLELAYAAAGAGMERGGATAARFLLVRAQSLPDWQEQRTIVCAAAAAAMARERRDTDTVQKAIETLHELDAADFPMEAADASDVLAREKAAPAYPNSRNAGPNYSRFFDKEGPCDCPDCRRARAGDESDDEYDPENPDDFFDRLEAPPGVPPEFAKMMIDEVKDSIARGESPNQFLNRVMGGAPPAGASRKKKGRRK